jgi:hypothetical protein
MIFFAHFLSLNILHIFQGDVKMELVILIAIIVVALGWFLWSGRMSTNSGSHPLDGATKNAVVEALDVNKDGKVDIKDAVAAAEVVVEKTKKTATKVKTKVKETAAKAKTAVKKPAAKKTATKKSK